MWTFWILLAGWVCLNIAFLAIRLCVTASRNRFGWADSVRPFHGPGDLAPLFPVSTHETN